MPGSSANNLASLRLKVGDSLLDLLSLARQLNESARLLIPQNLDDAVDLGWTASNVLEAIRISQKIHEFEVDALPKMSALEELSDFLVSDSTETKLAKATAKKRVTPKEDPEPARQLDLVGFVTQGAETVEEHVAVEDEILSIDDL